MLFLNLTSNGQNIELKKVTLIILTMKGGLWLLHRTVVKLRHWLSSDLQSKKVLKLLSTMSTMHHSLLAFGTTTKLNMWSWKFGFGSALKLSIWDTKCNLMSQGIQESRLSSRELLIVKVVRMQPFLQDEEKEKSFSNHFNMATVGKTTQIRKMLCGSFVSDLSVIVVWKAHWSELSAYWTSLYFRSFFLSIFFMHLYRRSFDSAALYCTLLRCVVTNIWPTHTSLHSE